MAHEAQMPRRLKRIVLAIIAVLLVVYFAAIRKEGAAAVSTGEWASVQRGDFEVVWRADGDLRPAEVTTLTFLRWGKVSFFIADGAAAKKGDKIVSLETTDLEENVRNFSMDLGVAEQALVQQEQTRAAERERLRTELLTEKQTAELARLTEKELLSHPTKLDLEGAQAVVDGAQTQLSFAETDLKSFAPLVEKGYGAQNEYEAKKLSVETGKINLEQARIDYDRVLMGYKALGVGGVNVPVNTAASAGPPPAAAPAKGPVLASANADRVEARLQREIADLSYKLKELDCQDQLNSLEARVEAARREVEHAKERLTREQEQLDYSTLYAPHDGIVVHLLIGWPPAKCEVGQWVGPWASPVALPNYTKMKVRTQVPESFISRLSIRQQAKADGKGARAGSKARVTIKTLANRVYEGEVVWIDEWARDRNANLSEADIKAQGLSGVRVFDVEVELQESDPQRLREGFRATVEFPLEVLKDVIWIPEQAVQKHEGKTAVQVLADGEPCWREVTLGAEFFNRVVVLSGLKAGEQVLLPRQQQAETKDEEGKAQN